MKRVITVSSGKGGVGKTTFAVNFALTLSRVAPTILVDLDTGTSSVRNTLDTPVDKDLYHFFRRQQPLTDCVTTLDDRLDPDGQFRDFAFVAAPRHAIDEITNLSEAARMRLMHAINELPASFVILDLRAGLDANVLDFLPMSNSSILVFTPHHPAATLAAGDIVKSLLFRKLRLVFAAESPIFSSSPDPRSDHRLVNELLDQVEDVYEEGLPNLDAFLRDLLDALGETRYVHVIANVVHSFGVYFVLNMFNGIAESYEAAVRPFVDYLTRHVSTRLHLTNLGWVVEDELIHRSNCERRPILLQPPGNPREEAIDAVSQQIASLESSVFGLPSPQQLRAPRRLRQSLPEIDALAPVERQLEILRAMYRSTGPMQVRQNFAYIAHRALHVMRNLPADAFGQPVLTTPSEFLERQFPSSSNA